MKLGDILELGPASPAPFGRELKHAVDVLDRLHSWPVTPRVPVVLFKSRIEDGGYYSLGRPNRPVIRAETAVKLRPTLRCRRHP